MKKSKAKEILGIEIGCEKKPLKQRFDEYRDLYSPDLLGSLLPESEKYIKQDMYKTMFIEYPEEVYISDDEKNLAFIKFAELNDAYNTLTKNPEYKEHSLDYFDLREYDAKRYGERISRFRYITERISAYSPLSVILLFLTVFSIGSLGKTLAEILCYLFVGTYLVQYICSLLSAPLDMLLILPSRLWRGIKKGAAEGFFILKPFAMVFYSTFYVLCGILALMFYPHTACTDRAERYKNSKKYKKFCGENVNARYCRTIDDIKSFREEVGEETYKNTANALKFYCSKGDHAVEEAIQYGRSLALEANPFYASEKARVEEKIKECEKDIVKLEKRLDRRMKLDFHLAYKTDMYGYTEFDDDYYESMTEQNFKEFEEDKDKKETQIKRWALTLSLIETRINLAALAESYIREPENQENFF